MNLGSSHADLEAERIGWFFRKPSEGDPQGIRRSNLYALRSDLCALLSPEDNATTDITAPMLAAIGMLSGIDLMAWTTTWPKEPTRTNFTSFLMKYGAMTEDDARALYQYRCAQVHSYGLFSVRKQGGTKTAYTFTLVRSMTERRPIVLKSTPEHPTNYSVALFALHDLFLHIISQFEAAVKSDLATRTTFLKAVEKIGFFCIEGWSI